MCPAVDTDTRPGRTAEGALGVGWFDEENPHPTPWHRKEV